MIAQETQRQTARPVTQDIFGVPGVVAFRVTIQPSPAGCVWSADACVLNSTAAPAPPQPKEAPAAPGHDTHVLDELFSRGL